jgi:hypothetical protein
MRNLIRLHGREEPMKGYLYDAFISYKRDPAFDVWMTTVVAILGSELQGYLGRDAALFFDVREIKTGDAWDDSLRLALRTSKCLVSFVSLAYFGSPWCCAEFETFRVRPGKVIVPIAVHTAGGRLKDRPELSSLQYLDVQKYHQSSPVFWQNPTLATEFEALLRSRVSDVITLIERAPPFQSDFPVVHPEGEAPPPTPRVSTRGKAGTRTKGETAAVAKPSTGKRGMVFLNTPFDERYRPMLEAMVFTVMSCGFMPRSVLESTDALSSLTRLDRVFRLMRQSQLSIHDLASGSRGNVLLEAGMLLAMNRLTPSASKFLILDDEPYAYRKFLSDLSGLDILFHKGDRQALVTHVRNWLAVNARVRVPGSAQIWHDYRSFQEALPKLAKTLNLVPDSILFSDLVQIVHSWQLLGA